MTAKIMLLDGIGYDVLRTLFSVFWQSSILLGACGVLIYFLRKRKASVQHVIWASALLLLPLLPLLSQINLSHHEIEILPAYAVPTDASSGLSTVGRAQLPTAQTGTAQPVIPEGSIQTGTASSLWEHRAFPGDYTWLLVFVAYLLIVAFFLSAVLAGRMRVRRWIFHGDPVVDDRTINLFERARQKVGLRREAAILESGQTTVPFTFFTFRPVVILPQGFAVRLSDAELEAVAAHELVHVRRYDPLIFTLISLVRAVFFFQPLVWFAAREVSYLAECVCDEAAVGLSGEAHSYARLISRLAEDLPRRTASPEYAAGLLFSRGVFLRRVTSILARNRMSRSRLNGLVTAGVVFFSAVTVITTLAFPLGGDDGRTPKANWIRGTVVDAQGRPLKGVRFVLSYFLVDKEKKRYKSKVATTDRHGHFRMEGLPVGVIAKTDIWNPNDKYYTMGVIIPLPPLFGSRQIKWEKLKQERIHTESHYDFPYLEMNRSHTFVLPGDPGGVASGRVVDEQGKPVQGARVSAEGPQEGPSGLTHPDDITDEDGRFRLIRQENLDHFTISAFWPFRAGVSQEVKLYGKVRDIPNKTEDVTIVLHNYGEWDRFLSPEERKQQNYHTRRRSLADSLPGHPAPEIDVAQWLIGEPVTLADLRGKVVVLFFWHEENRRSTRALVLLDYWRRVFAGKDVVFIAVHPYTDDMESVRRLAAEQSISVSLAVDRKSPIPEAQGETFDRYGTYMADSHPPAIEIIDQRGMICKKHVLPPGEWEEGAIKQLLGMKP